MTIVIAVDGTAASGKGTLAKKLARHFNFAHLDSGSLYRLVALGVLEVHGDPANEADALAATRADMTIDDASLILTDFAEFEALMGDIRAELKVATCNILTIPEAR